MGKMTSMNFNKTTDDLKNSFFKLNESEIFSEGCEQPAAFIINQLLLFEKVNEIDRSINVSSNKAVNTDRG